MDQLLFLLSFYQPPPLFVNICYEMLVKKCRFLSYKELSYLMAFNNTIGKYLLYYRGKRASDGYSIAQISLYDDSDKFVGAVYFYRDGQTIPNNSSNETSTPKRAYLRMYERQIDTVVDMLRNEKPCRIYYSSPTHATMYTGKEPVGEEEFEQ